MADYRLTQTGKEVQQILDNSEKLPQSLADETQARQDADKALEEAIAKEQTDREQAVSDEAKAREDDVKAERERAETAEKGISDTVQAHTSNGDIHVTTQNKAAWDAKYDKPATGIPVGDLSQEAQAAISEAENFGTLIENEASDRRQADATLQQLIQAVQTQLTNYYYQKSETYTKAETQAEVKKVQDALDALIGGDVSGAIDTFREVVEFLKGIEDTTLDALLKAIDQQITAEQTAREKAVSDEKTARENADTDEAKARQDADKVLAESLAEESDKLATVIKAIALNLTPKPSIALTADKTGQAVSYDSEHLVTKAGYAVSKPISVEKGRAYIIPAATIPASDVSPLSHFEDREYDKVIGYDYTYKTIYSQDGTEHEVIATATADYDTSLIYTYAYDVDAHLTAIVGPDGQSVGTTLPATRHVEETYYLPLVEQGWTPALSGTFLFVAPKTMQVVVSNVASSVSGTIEVYDLGLTENIGHNWLSKFDDQAEIESLASLKAQIDALSALVDNFGDVRARSIDTDDVPMVCGSPLILSGSGSPVTAGVSPMFVGQFWLDVEGKTVWQAVSVTDTPSADWMSAANSATLDKLRSDFDALVGTGDVTAKIDSFNEVIAFLAGIQGTTLDSLLSTIRTAVSTEETRAKGVEQGLNSRLTTAEGKISTAENNISSNATAISTEQTRAKEAESALSGSVAEETASRAGDGLVLTEAEAALLARIEALESVIDRLGDATARNIDLDNVPKVCGSDLILYGEGAPTQSPMFVGQLYVDTTTPALYCAKAVSDSTADWFLV